MRLGLNSGTPGEPTDGGDDADGSGDASADGADGEVQGGGWTDDVLSGSGGEGRLPRIAGFSVRPAMLPSPLAHVEALGEEDRVLLAGGAEELDVERCSDELLEYDPAVEEVRALQTLPHVNRGHEILDDGAGGLYLAMGFCGSTDEEARLYRLAPPTFEATHVADFSTPVFGFGGGWLRDAGGSEVIVAAGGRGSGPLYDVVQYLDPSTGESAAVAASLPSPRCTFDGAVSEGALFVFGGTEATDCVLPATATSNQLVDEIIGVKLSPPRADMVARLPEPMACSCAVTRDDGSILLFGGHRYVEAAAGVFDLEPLASVLVFEPVGRTVTAHEALLPEARTGLGCAATDDGSIYLFGGVDEGLAPSREILLFEPYADAHTLTGAVVDSGLEGATWVAARSESTVPTGTSIVLEVRTSEDPGFATGDSSEWTEALLDGDLPVGLAPGRYLEWRAELSTTDPRRSPELTSLSFAYEGG